ncbi:helix-turn-helix domain-containing protein [Alloscardovia macacae]|uniref:HTH cro/C1-type domain-containing protein n=1 Tax=Alloscardovia macacae TaxID=1160091 RepID=A0A261F4N5_9BIFI|nr:helix-turn-helix transcriptional regulator [Alloscardovia macacae]OZG54058.1 hypothetical protein ALMA_1022 [Alloscardovia macacae]
MANSLDNLFGKGLANERESAGYSQAEITKHMQSIGFDWNGMTLSRIERGQRKVTAGEAIALAQFFHVEVREIAGVESRYWDDLPIGVEEFGNVLLEVHHTMKQFGELNNAIGELFKVAKAYDERGDKEGRLKGFGEYTKAAELLEEPMKPLREWLLSTGLTLHDTITEVYTSQEFLDYLNGVDVRDGIMDAIPIQIQALYWEDDYGKYYNHDPKKDAA